MKYSTIFKLNPLHDHQIKGNYLINRENGGDNLRKPLIVPEDRCQYQSLNLDLTILHYCFRRESQDWSPD